MKGFWQLFDRKLWKFLLVGVVNTLVGSAIMFGLYNLAGWGYWVSSAMNYLLTSILSFFLNKYFTFQNKERSWWQVVKFVITVAVCWVLAYGIAKPAVAVVLSGMPLSQQMQGNLTMLVGAGLFVVLNYAGQRFFAFRSTEKNQ